MHGLTGLYSNQYYACSNKFSCDSEGTWWACHKKVVPGQDDSLDADLYQYVLNPVTVIPYIANDFGWLRIVA